VQQREHGIDESVSMKEKQMRSNCEIEGTSRIIFSKASEGLDLVKFWKTRHLKSGTCKTSPTPTAQRLHPLPNNGIYLPFRCSGCMLRHAVRYPWSTGISRDSLLQQRRDQARQQPYPLYSSSEIAKRLGLYYWASGAHARRDIAHVDRWIID
jgi:hypothetical protein